jgi:hypothetical protein
MICKYERKGMEFFYHATWNMLRNFKEWLHQLGALCIWLQHFHTIDLLGLLFLSQMVTTVMFAGANKIKSLNLSPHHPPITKRFFFKLLESSFNRACGTWIRSYPGKNVMKLIVRSLFAESRGRSTSVSTGSNDFRTCGVYLVKKRVIPETAVAPSSVSRKEATQAASIYVAVDSSHDSLLHNKITTTPA